MFPLCAAENCMSPSRCIRGGAAMRWCVSIGAALVAGAMAAAGVAAFAAPAAGSPPASALTEKPWPERPLTEKSLAEKNGTVSVDVELVLAVDVSYSMDMDELAI